METFFVIILMGIIAFATLSIYGWERIWASVAGDPDTGPVSFDGLKKCRKPNQALIAPPTLCDVGSVDRKSPVYSIPAEKLGGELLSSLEKERDLNRVDDRSNPLDLRFVQRSKRLRFPDTINVKIIPIDDDTSTLAL